MTAAPIIPISFIFRLRASTVLLRKQPITYARQYERELKVELAQGQIG